MFIGVNLTFFPQHFLGLNGIPRRYSEFPDSFFNFNIIRSFGSIISSVRAIIFLYMIFETFTCNRFVIYIDFQNSMPEFLNLFLPEDHTFSSNILITR
jgi:heme/copper-type cytochrome/quinol oxidase subunit 1